MRTRTLLIIVFTLTLAAIACGQSETPTLAPGVMETAVAQTVQAELAAQTAADEPTNTPSPSLTDTPPTVVDPGTSTPPPATPVPDDMSTLVPVQCAVDVAAEFTPRLDVHPEILSALGCPSGEGQQVWAAEARFQHGRMFWQEDTDAIHILYQDTGIYQVEANQYNNNDPGDACPEAGAAPDGLSKPTRGFNWHWCNTTGVQAELGWAMGKENGYNTVWQAFELGHALQSFANHIFVFYNDGTWDYIE